jgi:hypothetical protein
MKKHIFPYACLSALLFYIFVAYDDTLSRLFSFGSYDKIGYMILVLAHLPGLSYGLALALAVKPSTLVRRFLFILACELTHFSISMTVGMHLKPMNPLYLTLAAILGALLVGLWFQFVLVGTLRPLRWKDFLVLGFSGFLACVPFLIFTVSQQSELYELTAVLRLLASPTSLVIIWQLAVGATLQILSRRYLKRVHAQKEN